MNYTHTAESGLQVTRRFKIIRKFIGRHDFAGMDALNMGFNFHGRELHVKHTVGTDIPSMTYQYQFITCFDAIEHTFNPGLLLDDIHQTLKLGGTLYLSTPVRTFFKSKGHVAEYTVQVMRDMLEHYGFKIIRYETYRVWPLRFMFHGFRPFFRTLFNRLQIWECIK